LPNSKVPVKIEVDPDFDVFRILDASEKPSTFSVFYGADNFTYFHTGNDTMGKAIFDAWTSALAVRSQQVIIQKGMSLPKVGAQLLFGNTPEVLDLLKPLLAEANGHFLLEPNSIIIDGATYNFKDKVVVLSLKSSVNPKQTVTWILGPTPALTTAFAQRLLHYGNFSALIFDASILDQQPAEPIPNIYKKIWMPGQSAMKRNL
jgi:aminopeptidase N